MRNPLSWLKARFLPQAGPGSLPSIPLPKPPNKQVSTPSFKTQVAKATSVITEPDRKLANTDITTFRTGANTKSIIRDIAKSNADLAATVNAYLRVGIPEKYTVLAHDMDGAINPEATKLAQEVLRRMTFVGDPSLGWNPSSDIQGLSESLCAELLYYGAMSLELVLDKQRNPSYLQPVSVTKIKFREEDGGTYPVQVVAGVETSLDIATFYYLSLDQDLLSAYADSYLESAIQAVLADAQFMNDLRRSMQRVIQPRLIATLLEEKVVNSVGPDVRNDPDKLNAFIAGLIQNLTEQLTNLSPDEALVALDSVKYEMLTPNSGGGNVASTLETVQKMIESKLAAGAKTLPAVLGREATASAATTSTMLFMKNADVLRRKLNLIYSRTLTTAIRLLGQDVYVEFRYADLDLRPESELEAYKAMHQSRILAQLSLGLITDEEACVALTGNLPPPGYVNKSGTMFQSGSTQIANPDSQTSTMNKGGAPDNLKPSTPTKPKD